MADGHDGVHHSARPLPYGLEVCGCGAVQGVDGRWRMVDGGRIGSPVGVCRHPFVRRVGRRLVCASCGIDGGKAPARVDYRK